MESQQILWEQKSQPKDHQSMIHLRIISLTSMEAVDHTNCIHDNFGFIHSFEGLPISDLMPKFGSPKPHWSGAGALQPNGVFLLSKTLKGFLGPLGDLGKKLLWYTYAPWGPLP